MINRKIEVTETNFDKIGFSESELLVSVIPLAREVNQRHVTLFAWGIDVPHELLSEWSDVPDFFSDRYYIQGWTEVTFFNTSKMHIETALYDNDSGTRFLKKDNDIFSTRYDWEDSDCTLQNESHKFQIFGVMIWPFGYAEIEVYSSPTVEMCFNHCNAVPVSEFVMNTKKYVYKKS